jgi:hypothetical protein
MLGIEYDKADYNGNEGIGGGGQPQLRQQMSLAKFENSLAY